MPYLYLSAYCRLPAYPVLERRCRAKCRLKRAGLDYWPYVCVKVHDDWPTFLLDYDKRQSPKRLVAFSKFATLNYAVDNTYLPGDVLLFGAETHGLPDRVSTLKDCDHRI